MERRVLTTSQSDELSLDQNGSKDSNGHEGVTGTDSAIQAYQRDSKAGDFGKEAGEDAGQGRLGGSRRQASRYLGKKRPVAGGTYARLCTFGNLGL